MIEPLIAIFKIVVFPGLAFITLLGLVYEWIDRKAVARFQNRIGPLYAGPRGFLQPLADFLKLMAKEDIVPTWADKLLFNAVPLFAVTIPTLASLYIPITGYPVLPPFEGDLVLVVALTTFFTITAFIAGLASTNRFSTIGAERAALQLLGFEIPMFISVASAAMAAGSLSITVIAERQFLPFALLQPLGFAVYLIALQAELERVPFDIPEAESEIVAGWLTEFSGKKLAFLRLSADIRLVLGAALATAIFLGGGSGPVLPPIVWFLIKSIAIVIVSAMLRALFARLRIDQMVRGAWKYLLPLSMLQLLMTKILLLVVV
ncbi:MAG: NADH-quinone oxidoreductase subunit H [Candidatus Methanomethylicota archaeon]|nr:NADH-quinone oxidoreductase subunit H [Candidatus Culexmicrobium cathedralense]RLE48433.1 MAG: NADH-quinone oxidoreductase subunit H [Candidatus Verstraetearchaeota archaeon]